MNAIARTGTAGLGEQVSFGGARARGFALGAAGDPEIWSKLNAAQQGWVMGALSTLNGLITKTNPGSMCPGWVTPSGASGITAATGCFQMWFDSVYPPGNAVKQLRTDGVFDQDTLDGLKLIASLHPTDFPTPFPGTVATTKKLSTAGMVGIGAGVLTTAGVVYVVAKGGLSGMHKKSRKSRRRK